MVVVAKPTRIDFLGYIWDKALTKHIKHFFKEKITVKGGQCLD